ncbi:MAG TPA: GNAT family N-acetyltransferase [Trueperaceae bacterium]|nr:GNAT family N-acetyltransferase [Trueperaceae bacterium]
MSEAQASDQVFVTERLRARRWRDSDLEPLLAVYGDADAMRWVGDGSQLDPGEALRWLDVTRANYALRGYGMFALEDLDTGAVVGFIGIVHPGGQPEPEVKYAFARDRWGKGLATEAVRGVVEYGSSVHGLRRMIATTAPENVASHRVLLKSGFEKGDLRDNGDETFTQLFDNGWCATRS